MTRLLSAELLKLRSTRSLLAPLGASLAMVLFVTYQLLDRAGVDGDTPVGSAEHLRQLIGVSGMVAVVMLLFGALAGTADLRHRTAIGDVLAVPSRWPVAAAKALAVLVVAAGWALVTAAVQLALLLPALRDADAKLLELMTTDLWAHLAASLAVGPLMALLGAGLGLVVRHQAAAAGGGLLWFAFLEHEISAGSPALGKWLPATSALAMGGVSHGADVTAGGGAVLLTAWALGLAVLGAVLFVRRDV